MLVTYLRYELGHELHDGRVVAELPYEHGNLFHWYPPPVIPAKYIVNELVLEVLVRHAV